MIHAYSSLPHYGDHIAPILAALPDEIAGEMWTPSERKPWGLPIGAHTPRDGLWIVAGYADARKMAGRPLVYVEHGAGQTYPGDPRSKDHGSFSGGAGLDDVALFVCPSETVAARWRDRYPSARAVAVGSPKMDRWHRRELSGDFARIWHRTPLERPVVAVTFHHDNAQIPEQHSAWTHYREAIPALRYAVDAAGGTLLGHGHPRNWSNLRNYWRRIGVACTADLGDVFDRADLLIGDNTSALPEFASVGRPVLWLNAPWYRRDVHHGGRFWDWPLGQITCDNPADLIARTRMALDDPTFVRRARTEMVRDIYAATDGHAAERAAAAIVDLVR